MSVKDYAKISNHRIIENLTEMNTSKNQESIFRASLEQNSSKAPDIINAELATTRTGLESKTIDQNTMRGAPEVLVFSARTAQREKKFDMKSKKLKQLDKIHYSVDGLTEYSMDGFDTNREGSLNANISLSITRSDVKQ